jgi:hypothetical protein
MEYIIVGAIIFGVIGFFIDGGKGAIWGASERVNNFETVAFGL